MSSRLSSASIFALVPLQDTIASDGKGSVIFDGPVTVDSVEATPQEVVRPDGTTEVVDAIVLEDVLTGDNITIPATGSVQVTPDSTVEIIGNELGSLTVNPTTNECVLITEGKTKGNQGKGKGNQNSKVKTVISGTCKDAGNENIAVTEEGTAVMNDEGALEVAQKADIDIPQTDEGSGESFVSIDPAEGNTGSYQFGIPTDDAAVTMVPIVGDQVSTCIRDVGFTKQGQPKEVAENPIKILGGGINDGYVKFHTGQSYKTDTISWMATAIKDFDCPGPSNPDKEVCIKVNGLNSMSSYSTSTYYDQVGCGEGDQTGKGRPYPVRKVKCVDGFARVDVFIHDGSKSIGQSETGPWPESVDGPSGSTHDVTAAGKDWVTAYMDAEHPTCEASQDLDNKCWYRYQIDCSQVGGGGGRRLTESAGGGGGRSLLRGLVPRNILSKPPAVDDRILFAKNIVEKCPELAGGKVFNSFKFGLNVNDQMRNNGAVSAMQ